MSRYFRFRPPARPLVWAEDNIQPDRWQGWLLALICIAAVVVLAGAYALGGD